MYLTNICTSYRIRVKFADKLTLRQISHFIFMKTDKDMIEEVTPTEIEARTSIGGCQLIRKTTPQTMNRDEFEIWRLDTRIHDDTDVDTPDPGPESCATSPKVLSLKIEIVWFRFDHQRCNTLLCIFGFDLILLQSIMLHFVSFIKSPIGIDLLVERKGKIKLNSDFDIYFYKRRVTKLIIHVGRRGAILGHATPSLPTSTYKASNLATHTSLCRALQDHNHSARQNLKTPNTNPVKCITYHSLFRVECFLNTKNSTMMSHKTINLTVLTETDAATISCISEDVISGPAFREFIQVSFCGTHLLNKPYAKKKISDNDMKDLRKTTMNPGSPCLPSPLSADVCSLSSTPSEPAVSPTIQEVTKQQLIQPKSSIAEASAKRASGVEKRVFGIYRE